MFSAAYILFLQSVCEVLSTAIFQQRYLRTCRTARNSGTLSRFPLGEILERLVRTSRHDAKDAVIPVFNCTEGSLSLRRRRCTLSCLPISISRTCREKRGMDIPYTSFSTRCSYRRIHQQEIESISSARFAGRLSEYERFIETSVKYSSGIACLSYSSRYFRYPSGPYREKINRPMVGFLADGAAFRG